MLKIVPFNNCYHVLNENSVIIGGLYIRSDGNWYWLQSINSQWMMCSEQLHAIADKLAELNAEVHAMTDSFSP